MREIIKTMSNAALIPAYQFLAVRKRYEGMTSENISAKIKEIYNIDIKDSTIRYWFYKGGPLAVFYREYADQMIEMEKEEVRDFFKGNLKKAAMTLANVMAGAGGPAQVMAAKEFLERGMGKVIDKADVRVGHYSLADLVKEETLIRKEAEKNARRIKENNGESNIADLPNGSDEVF